MQTRDPLEGRQGQACLRTHGGVRGNERAHVVRRYRPRIGIQQLHVKRNPLTPSIAPARSIGDWRTEPLAAVVLHG
jgi:hypothetical protein